MLTKKRQDGILPVSKVSPFSAIVEIMHVPSRCTMQSLKYSYIRSRLGAPLQRTVSGLDSL
jgi:hypothetical protein